MARETRIVVLLDREETDLLESVSPPKVPRGVVARELMLTAARWLHSKGRCARNPGKPRLQSAGEANHGGNDVSGQGRSVGVGGNEYVDDGPEFVPIDFG